MVTHRDVKLTLYREAERAHLGLFDLHSGEERTQQWKSCQVTASRFHGRYNPVPH